MRKSLSISGHNSPNKSFIGPRGEDDWKREEIGALRS